MLRADLMHDNAHKDHPFFKHIAPAKTIYGSEDETKAAFYEGNPYGIICDKDLRSAAQFYFTKKVDTAWYTDKDSAVKFCIGKHAKIFDNGTYLKSTDIGTDNEDGYNALSFASTLDPSGKPTSQSNGARGFAHLILRTGADLDMGAAADPDNWIPIETCQFGFSQKILTRIYVRGGYQLDDNDYITAQCIFEIPAELPEGLVGAWRRAGHRFIDAVGRTSYATLDEAKAGAARGSARAGAGGGPGATHKEINLPASRLAEAGFFASNETIRQLGENDPNGYLFYSFVGKALGDTLLVASVHHPNIRNQRIQRLMREASDEDIPINRLTSALQYYLKTKDRLNHLRAIIEGVHSIYEFQKKDNLIPSFVLFPGAVENRVEAQINQYKTLIGSLSGNSIAKFGLLLSSLDALRTTFTSNIKGRGEVFTESAKTGTNASKEARAKELLGRIIEAVGILQRRTFEALHNQAEMIIIRINAAADQVERTRMAAEEYTKLNALYTLLTPNTTVVLDNGKIKANIVVHDRHAIAKYIGSAKPLGPAKLCIRLSTVFTRIEAGQDIHARDEMNTLLLDYAQADAGAGAGAGAGAAAAAKGGGTPKADEPLRETIPATLDPKYEEITPDKGLPEEYVGICGIDGLVRAPNIHPLFDKYCDYLRKNEGYTIQSIWNAYNSEDELLLDSTFLENVYHDMADYVKEVYDKDIKLVVTDKNTKHTPSTLLFNSFTYYVNAVNAGDDGYISDAAIKSKNPLFDKNDLYTEYLGYSTILRDKAATYSEEHKADTEAVCKLGDFMNAPKAPRTGGEKFKDIIAAKEEEGEGYLANVSGERERADDEEEDGDELGSLPAFPGAPAARAAPVLSIQQGDPLRTSASFAGSSDSESTRQSSIGPQTSMPPTPAHGAPQGNPSAAAGPGARKSLAATFAATEGRAVGGHKNRRKTKKRSNKKQSKSRKRKSTPPPSRAKSRHND